MKIRKLITILLLSTNILALTPMNVYAVNDEISYFSDNGDTPITLADNPYLAGSYGRELRGSSYWTTSNIREWLNSDKEVVGYTNNHPSSEYMGGNAYDKEAGFLNSFTQEEKDAIAITERRILIQDIDAIARLGGSSNLGHLNNYSPVFLANYTHVATSYKNYSYKKDNDKVFLLTPFECYWYLNRRNFSYNRPLTEQAKSKNNTTANNAHWWLQGGTLWQDWDRVYYAQYSTNLCSNTNANTKLGIVPAINIKPTYIFSNGVKASDLKIGDEVTFGTYLNAPIKWQIINISDSGYPLLLSTNILDLKLYDASGDQSKQYSEYINFQTADISMFNDVEYKSTTGSSDIDVPITTVLNPEELGKRQNGSFTLNFSVTDSGSGVDWIILPNGQKITNTEFSYTFSNNGNYVIKTMDKAGNYNEFLVPVSNVNKEPEVLVTPSTTSWTNQDVNIDIKASNDVKIKTSFQLTNLSEWGSSLFPNYTSYVGKKFRVTGTLKLISYNEKGKNAYIGIGHSFRGNGKNSYTYTMSGSWTRIKNITFNELMSNNGEVPFDFEFTVPSNYVQNLQGWIHTGLNQSLGEAIRIEFKDLQYELLDDSDFAITKISLPSGKEVLDSKSYIDTISKEGNNNYKYTVLDNRGKETSKTINVKIDKTKPVLNLNYSTAISNEFTVSVTSSDTLSGIKRIKLPSGSYVNSSSTSYKINNNGNYTFEVEDNAGNITSKIITVSNIDKTAPTINIVKDKTDWTKDDINLTIIATDSQSNVDKIKLPNGTYVSGSKANYTVTNNGTYTFEAYDIFANKSVSSITISNIDKTNPSISSNIAYNSSKTTATINISTSDLQSGIDYIVDFKGNTINNSKITEVVTDNGMYLFEVFDKAGNKTLKSINVDGLVNNQNNSGISKIEYKLSGATVQDWTTYAEAFYITNEGITIITARSYDIAGNISSEVTSQVKIDKTKPINTGIKIELK